MERDQATKLVHGLLKKMVDKNGSDLFITSGFPPAIKIDGEIHRAAEQPLTGDESAIIVRSIMNDRQARDFDATKECNFAIGPQGIGRFRVSAFIQRGGVGAVLRRIVTKIPTLEELDLPPIMQEIALTKRGQHLGHAGELHTRATLFLAAAQFHLVQALPVRVGEIVRLPRLDQLS